MTSIWISWSRKYAGNRMARAGKIELRREEEQAQMGEDRECTGVQSR